MNDRLERLERHLDKVLAGPRRLMRSLSKTTTGTDAMTDPNEYAHPIIDTEPRYDHNRDLYAHVESSGGLTKRELFAAMAMQAIITKNPPCGEAHDISECPKPGRYAKAATACADALIAELNKRDDNGQA